MVGLGLKRRVKGFQDSECRSLTRIRASSKNRSSGSSN